MENQTDPMKIALETLTERCKQLEQRVNDVEGENTRLRLVCSKVEDTKQDSLNEIDLLKQRNTQLREQNTQLKNNIQMVASENRQLWSKLSSLSEVNQTLGKKISKINSSLIEHSNKITTEPSQTQLIRSKTFTQNEPYLKYQQNNVVDEGNKISLELEDISLKLITSIVKEKYELQAQCNEMMELQSEEVNSMFGFAYPGDDLEESVLDNLEKHINDLKSIKQNVQLERQVILNNITAMKNITVDNDCKTCTLANNSNYQTSDMNGEDVIDLTNNEMVQTNTSPIDEDNGKVMCPMCSKVFTNTLDLQLHVEGHFLES